MTWIFFYQHNKSPARTHLAISILFCALLVGCSTTGHIDTANQAFADIHLHFNWDQKEIISVDEIIKILDKHNVSLGVVSSVPTELALELHHADPNRIIPLFSPYLSQALKASWYLHNEVVDKARQGLANNLYRGIGELHLWSNLPPRFDNRVLNGLLDLSEEFSKPFLIHTESSNMRYFLELCLARPNVRFLWAHAGGILDATQVDSLMAQCPNVWVELSARDTWRYNTLTDEHGKLPLTWANVITKYVDRFMTGTDPVWAVTRMQRWDEADDGWDHYSELISYHRNWLNQLPTDVARKVRLENAIHFFTP